jgi:fido (protein-threonine AMPylation protein)
VPTAWETDVPGLAPRIQANSQAVLTAIATEADRRKTPTVAMAQQWHRELFDGIPRPYDYYAGEVRDSDQRFLDLVGYEVEVGGIPGVPSAAVPAALVRFEQQVQAATANLDPHIEAGSDPSTLEPRVLHAVLTLCAYSHGIWVQIHPFANGNGRTARLWANWAALRYGLPPFVSVKPRPTDPYGAGALASMTGDHSVMVAVMDQMLRGFLAQLP